MSVDQPGSSWANVQDGEGGTRGADGGSERRCTMDGA